MPQAFVVGLGGFLGAVARDKVGGFILHRWPASNFPWGTLTVNITGCFLIGLLAGVISRLEVVSSEYRAFLITGILGGFTTFSSFGFETMFLLRRGEVALAIGNVAANVILGLILVWVGLSCAEFGAGN